MQILLRPYLGQEYHDQSSTNILKAKLKPNSQTYMEEKTSIINEKVGGNINLLQLIMGWKRFLLLCLLFLVLALRSIALLCRLAVLSGRSSQLCVDSCQDTLQFF